MNLFKNGNKAAEADFIDFGGKRVEIPKLTIEKWKLLFTKIEMLPSLIIQVIMARHTPDMTTYILAAVEAGLDEIIELVAAVTGLEANWIEKNVGITELIAFIEKTIRKNDFVEAGKKFRAVFGNMAKANTAKGMSQSMNGSSNALSDSE